MEVVGIEATKLSLSVNKKRIIEGDTIILSLDVTPSTAKEDLTFKWISSDKTIGTVSNTGEFKEKSGGRVLITVVASDGRKATCQIDVIGKIPVYRLYQHSSGRHLNTTSMQEAKNLL